MLHMVGRIVSRDLACWPFAGFGASFEAVAGADSPSGNHPFDGRRLRQAVASAA